MPATWIRHMRQLPAIESCPASRSADRRRRLAGLSSVYPAGRRSAAVDDELHARPSPSLTAQANAQANSQSKPKHSMTNAVEN
jgi:hypothetical protein